MLEQFCELAAGARRTRAGPALSGCTVCVRVSCPGSRMSECADCARASRPLQLYTNYGQAQATLKDVLRERNLYRPILIILFVTKNLISTQC